MLKPLIDALQQSRAITKLEMNGFEYFGTYEGIEIPPPEPKPDCLYLTTLQGLVDSLAFFHYQKAGDTLALVVTHERVTLLSTELVGRHLYRPIYAIATAPSWEWPHKQFEQDEFLVAMMTRFAPTEYRDYLIRIASNLATERVMTHDDDGLTQRVSVRQGLRRVAEEAIRPIGELRPYRSFSEIEPPASQFLLRIDTVSQPRLCLYEAKDQRWKLNAAAAIAQWLRERTDIPVIV